MAILTRDQILNAMANIPPTLELIEVPEWGGSVHVGILSGAQRDRVEAAYASSKAKDSIRATMAVYALRDEANKPVFSEADVAQLKELSGIALDRVFKAAMRINGMDQSGNVAGAAA